MDRESVGDYRTWNSLFIPLIVGISGIYIFHLWDYGLRTFPDTLTYNSAARALTNGEGLVTNFGGGAVKPLTHFPPLLPIFLSAIFWSTPLILESFLVINSISLLCCSLISYYLLSKVFSSRSIALLLTICFLIHPVTFQIFRSGISEPLYLLFLLLFLHLMIDGRYLSAGVSAALTMLTRYSGLFIFFYIPGLVLLPYGRKFSLRDLAMLFFPPLIIMGIWLGRNIYLTGQLTGRAYVATSPNFGKILQELSDTVLYKFLLITPGEAPQYIALLILIIPFLGFFFEKNSTLSLCYLLSLALIIIARLTVDAEVALNERILFLPMVLLLFITLGSVLSLLLTVAPLGLLYSFISFLLLAIPLNIPPERPNNSPFESHYWKHSETTQYLLSSPAPNSVFYSNGPDFLRFYLGRDLLSIPAKTHAGTRTEIPNSLELFRGDINSEKENIFIFLNGIRWRWYLWEEKALVEALNLKVIHSFSDGRVYKIEGFD